MLGYKNKGYEIDELLRQSNISKTLLCSANNRIHSDQMTRLIQAIWNQLEDEFMGFTESTCKPGSFAMMSELVSYCDTTDAVFLKGTRFYELMTDDINMEYRLLDKHREFVVSMKHPELDSDHFFLEFWLVIWHRFVSWIIGTKIHLQSAHFTYPEPAYSDEFKHQFACPCYFSEAETKICFSKKYGCLPPVRTQRELANFLKNSPADLMVIPGEDDSISFQIKRLLQTDVDSLKQFPKLEDIAESLHISPQTIRRKLKEEGSSYQKIKDSTRCDIAIEKLKIQNLSVDHVAVMLGFSEPRSFTRAFKQWTGVTPSQYRAKF